MWCLGADVLQVSLAAWGVPEGRRDYGVLSFLIMIPCISR